MDPAALDNSTPIGSQFNFIDWSSQLNDDTRPFDKVAFNLSRLCGAIPARNFLANEYDDIDLDYHNLQFASTKPPLEAGPSSHVERGGSASAGAGDGSGKEEASSSGGATHVSELPAPPSTLQTPLILPSNGSQPLTRVNARNILHQTCFRLSGSADALNFETVISEGEDAKQTFGCILTIRSLGNPTNTRTFQTTGDWPTPFEAKGEAARIAIELGALEFLRTGDMEVQKHKKAELIVRARVEEKKLEEQKPPDDSVVQIDTCCRLWRPGQDVQYWVTYRPATKEKGKDEYGAALRIALTPHQLRTYSTSATYPSMETAKAACAQQAIAEGVLEYIKFGNGQQVQPSMEQADKAREAASQKADSPPKRYSLQEFFDSLPRPFPLDIGQKQVHEIQATNYVNSLIQGAKLPGVRTTYFSTNSDIRGGGGLSGCVLRIEGPESNQAKTYILEPHFAKRQDAKAAVALLAISQNVVAYVKQLEVQFDKFFPKEHKVLAETKIIPDIVSLATNLKTGNKVKWETHWQHNAFGCSMIVDVSADEDNPDIRTYKVGPRYRTKADARLAVACLAAKEGVMEAMQFGEQGPPAGHPSYWSTVSGESQPGTQPTQVKKPNIDKTKDVSGGGGANTTRTAQTGPSNTKKRKRTEEATKAKEDVDEELGEIVEPSVQEKTKGSKPHQAPSAPTKKPPKKPKHQKANNAPRAGPRGVTHFTGPPLHLPYPSDHDYAYRPPEPYSSTYAPPGPPATSWPPYHAGRWNSPPPGSFAHDQHGMYPPRPPGGGYPGPYAEPMRHGSGSDWPPSGSSREKESNMRWGGL